MKWMQAGVTETFCREINGVMAMARGLPGTPESNE